MVLERDSPCKVNLVLNVLGKRSDGFHELETIMHPVRVCDRLRFERGGWGIQLTCSHPALPTDGRNLVYRAAAAFLEKAGIREGVRLHLDKHLPMAAGLGGGSANAATTLQGLNCLFDSPLEDPVLSGIAVELGSDVAFFLQDGPALATGRGEKIQARQSFAALRGLWFILVHPGFGISTAWAYQQLARFPKALNGEPGRAARAATLLETMPAAEAVNHFYNSFEAPAFEKFPVLALFKEFLLEQGSLASLLCGSGSATFALAQSQTAAEQAVVRFKDRFGDTNWIALAPV